EAQGIYRGFLFVRTSPEGPGLQEFLGPIRDVIDDLVERSPKHELRCKPAVLRHRYRGNWKLTFENLNDTIHAGFAHAVAARIASDLVAEAPERGGDPLIGLMMANGKPISFFQGLRMTLGQYGHSYFEAHMPTAYPDDVAAALTESFAANDRTAPRGLAAGNDKHLGLLYPNAIWHARYQVVRMVYPIAPDETEVVTLSFGLEGAPESTYDSARSYCNGSSSAMSPVITDDLEIYEAIQANYRHLGGWHPISRGLDEDASSTEPMRQARATSEAFIRNQYRTWLAYLGASEHD
ncbi:MAG: SRPBCC family protein, partial [Pigmentiphaga sp.]